jgi:hydroxymethylpyrimidine/phosphomethylpyrimidine kinase
MNYKAKVLTIAGSDSSGGAGIQADLKTFHTFEVYGMSVITAITSQNTRQVKSIQDIDPQIISDQIDMVFEDIRPDALKIGMVSTEKTIKIISKKLKEHNFDKIVLDPVMVSKGGENLLKKNNEKVLIEELIPISYLVTPNIPEAEIISEMPIKNLEDMKKACIKIYEKGAKNVLLKGGHFEEEKATDILYDGTNFYEYSEKRINSKNTHGTGCTISAAITSLIAQNYTLNDALTIAKDFITKAIKYAPENIGHGHGPLYHNVKPVKIQHFKYHADEFDKWFKSNKILFQNELKAQKKALKNPKKTLSVGIGDGLFAKELGIIEGVEPSEDMARLAKEKGLNVKIGYAEKLPYDDESWEYVFLGTIMASVNDKRKSIQEAVRVCKKNGEVIVSILPRESSFPLLYDLSYLKGEFDKDISPEYPYPLEFLKDTKWASVEEVTNLMKECGLKNIEYIQTLTMHPKYSNIIEEEPKPGYTHGDYVVIKGVKID